MIYNFGKFSLLWSSISPQNQDQFWWFFIPWKRFEVLFNNLPLSPIFIINSSSDLINFREIIINFLISLWIQPLFNIKPLNSRYFHQIGKFGLCFDTRPCEIDDLTVSARQPSNKVARLYRLPKLNATKKNDHFPLPFSDQILDRPVGQSYFCFLDGYSGYNQIAIHPDDQEKRTFTCPFGTFAFRWMPFRLWNAPETFQRCMTTIFSYFLSDNHEVFMDDFSVFGDDINSILAHLTKIL